jgi:AraC-like DNA-binding protein
MIASSLGYESESAFGKAFRRVMDCSPRQYGSRTPGSSTTREASYDPMSQALQ